MGEQTEDKSYSDDQIEKYQQALLGLFNDLMDDPKIDKNKLVRKATGAAKDILRQVAIMQKSCDLTEIDKFDFVMGPKDMIQAMEMMSQGFTDTAKKLKEKAY